MEPTPDAAEAARAEGAARQVAELRAQLVAAPLARQGETQIQ